MTQDEDGAEAPVEPADGTRPARAWARPELVALPATATGNNQSGSVQDADGYIQLS